MAGRDGKILHRKAYGQRALVPSREPMTIDTIFDAASAHQSHRDHFLRHESCSRKASSASPIPSPHTFPSFQRRPQRRNHYSRFDDAFFRPLAPTLTSLPNGRSGYETGIHRALIDRPAGPPGLHFVYSDINFELMGEIVRRLSGKPLNEYAREKIFTPLSMTDSMFNPPASLLPAHRAHRKSIPPTGAPFRGVVHDPTSRFMGGVAGLCRPFHHRHGPLKVCRDDVVNGGERNGVAYLLTAHHSRNSLPARNPAGSTRAARSRLGHRFEGYSSNRGELYPIGSYGHTRIHRYFRLDRSFPKVLRQFFSPIPVHPARGKNLGTLRSRVATIFAAAIGVDAPGVSVVGYNEALGAAPVCAA